MSARLIVFVLICFHSCVVRGEILFDWATVGDAGNAPSTNAPGAVGSGGEGSVDYEYRISKHEVTNEQYAEFLDAVALEDPHALFHPDMGITRTGTSGEFRYAAKTGFERHPVILVSFLSAMRFVNWLENGQGEAGTESGTYTIGTGVSETRASNATYFIPNNDEWYKAAFYDPTLADGAGGYWRYATQSSEFPTFEAPPGGTNSVNTAESNLDGTTEVGAYSDSVSYYGTFDQTGNAWEWTEAHAETQPFRCMRGGGYGSSLAFLTTCHRPEIVGDGFRVGSVATLLGDCNADGVLNAADLSCVSSLEGRDAILGALNTLPGDLDGDGEVGSADFVVLSRNFATDLPRYTDGNIDLKDGVNFEDFLVLASNFGEPPIGTATVPEPNGIAIVWLCMLVAALRRRVNW